MTDITLPTRIYSEPTFTEPHSPAGGNSTRPAPHLLPRRCGITPPITPIRSSGPGEADLEAARWLRQPVPEALFTEMAQGDRPFLTKPAHRFIDGQDYSICGAKKRNPHLVGATVPANSAKRDLARRAGRMVCPDCIRISWVRGDTLSRNCSAQQLRSLPQVTPPAALTPVRAVDFLQDNSDRIIPARIVAIEPTVSDSESALRIHFDSSPGRGVAYTPVAMLLPHLDALRMIHSPRSILFSGLQINRTAA